MNPKDIQLDIRSPRSRSVGQLPPIGKVTRLRESSASVDIAAQQLQYGNTSTYDRGGNPALRKLILLWSIALGTGTALIIGAAISFWILPYLRQRNHAASVKLIDPEMRVRIVSRFSAPGEDEALSLVRHAMANRDPAKVGALFHTGSANAAEVIGFFKNAETRDGAVTHCDWLSSIDGDGLPLEGVQVAFKGIDKPGLRLALLTPDDNGVWKMDFDSFARSVRPSWQELLDNHAARATVRVVVGRDVYFNGPFSDEKRWSCYGIASPDVDVLLRGYCAAGSAQESAMERLLAGGTATSRATLEIRHVPEGDSRQFEITSVLAKDWVVSSRNLTAGDPGGR